MGAVQCAHLMSLSMRTIVMGDTPLWTSWYTCVGSQRFYRFRHGRRKAQKPSRTSRSEMQERTAGNGLGVSYEGRCGEGTTHRVEHLRVHLDAGALVQFLEVCCDPATARKREVCRGTTHMVRGQRGVGRSGRIDPSTLLGVAGAGGRSPSRGLEPRDTLHSLTA